MTDGAAPPFNPAESKKVLAGILGLLLGAWGVHRFIIGDSKGGIIRIVITILTCGIGGIIGFIEGIIFLTKSDEEFHRVYMVEKKAWF
ncbi:MAG: NINE protein [Planctomycetes bacterium]|nr:NINE protein [Planctomycetota bacterium]